MTGLQYLQSLRPAIPMSTETPCTHTSNGELKRWMLNGAVLLNGRALRPDDEVAPSRVESLVFFPKSPRRTTIV
jgi:hypothetical protein